MKIHLIAVGDRMPSWVETAFKEYNKRLPQHFRLNLIEIPMAKRSKNCDIQQCIAKESLAILQAIPKDSYIVALEVNGHDWSTPQLSQELEQWQRFGRDITLLVGGPDGLSPQISKLADKQWSLSNLTLPHPIVRVIIAETLYRAWTLLIGHPYHK